MSPLRARRAILILADGLRPDVLEEQLEAGAIPNLAQLTAQGGRRRAITVFPSTTSVAYLPYLTGRFPGAVNIPSIRWMDRSKYSGRWWREREAAESLQRVLGLHRDHARCCRNVTTILGTPKPSR